MRSQMIQTRPRCLNAASAPEAVHSTSRSGGRIGQNEPAGGIRAEMRDDVQRVHDVVLGLRHLGRRDDISTSVPSLEERLAVQINVFG